MCYHDNSPSETKWTVIAVAFFLVVTAVYAVFMYAGLDDSYVPIYDNLVSWASWGKIRSMADIPFFL